MKENHELESTVTTLKRENKEMVEKLKAYSDQMQRLENILNQKDLENVVNQKDLEKGMCSIN